MIEAPGVAGPAWGYCPNCRRDYFLAPRRSPTGRVHLVLAFHYYLADGLGVLGGQAGRWRRRPCPGSGAVPAPDRLRNNGGPSGAPAR